MNEVYGTIWNNTVNRIIVPVWIVHDCMYFSKSKAYNMNDGTDIVSSEWIVLDADERVNEGEYCYHARWNSEHEAIEGMNDMD